MERKQRTREAIFTFLAAVFTLSAFVRASVGPAHALPVHAAQVHVGAISAGAGHPIEARTRALAATADPTSSDDGDASESKRREEVPDEKTSKSSAE